MVGPISPYSVFHRSLAGAASGPPRLQCILRFVTGIVKFFFLARLTDQLSYRGLLLDGHPHRYWPDLPVAMVFYYLYVYLNFSGWCDMAIGVSGLLGIDVAENFDHPFLARNLQEYWTRWHMTLSSYMRDVVFSPLSLSLTRAWGARYSSAAIAVSISVVFLVIGLWHGMTANFVVYGLLQGLGVVVAYFYTIYLRRFLGREGYAAYMKNPWIRGVAVATTFAYTCLCLFFFANSFPQFARLLTVLR